MLATVAAAMKPLPERDVKANDRADLYAPLILSPNHLSTPASRTTYPRPAIPPRILAVRLAARSRRELGSAIGRVRRTGQALRVGRKRLARTAETNVAPVASTANFRRAGASFDGMSLSWYEARGTGDSRVSLSIENDESGLPG